MLSNLPAAHPTFSVRHLVQDAAPPSGAYTPAQIQQAYQFNQVSFNGATGNGSGETIAIVDAYDDPYIQSDLNTFDAQFGLPAATLTRVNESGGTSLPAADRTGGWELEESLDVEWAHAMAPGANLLLVEASSANDSDLVAAVGYAAAHANVVSMSWGEGEFSGESSYDGEFSHPGVAFVASSGDSGAPISWPAASPNVLAVGGTALTLGSGNSWAGETGWSGSGGGPSSFEAQPSYQSGIVTGTTMRANPDVAYNASPSTGFAVYDSNPYSGTSYGWLAVGGTSAGAPQWAAILAVADQGRAVSGQPALDSSSAQEVMTSLYEHPGDFHDITTGTSTGTPNYSAAPGYDYVTGLGSPMVNLVIASLDGGSPTAVPDTLVVSAPSTTTAGDALSITVTAETASGTPDPVYAGTIDLTSTDGQAVLPAGYTFTPSDGGSHTFTVTLETAGTQAITATDTSGSAAAGISAGIAVSPAAASQFVISGLSSSTIVGVGQGFTVTAEDPYGNVATGYTGTAQFASSDASATLPADYTFTRSDSGSHAFSVTFATAGSQSLAVSDLSGGFSATQSGIKVAPAAATNLVATAISSSQINLTWTAAAGATGYQVWRGQSPTSGWIQIAAVSGGTTTSYPDTGLSAGTTYDYRIIANGGGLSSSPSSTAQATTTATATTTTVSSLWSSSYTPSENAYSWGEYELGLKFTSSQAGEVTGVRFYKQSWMGGYTHVGHLWSSTGTLLATATFTGETASGWQQVDFASPVDIQPSTVYIVSFSTGGGYFGISTNDFSQSGVTNGPLQAPSSSAVDGNGVYESAGDFPDVSGGGMNFWVDVAFAPATTTSVTTGPAPSGSTPSTGGGSSGSSQAGLIVPTPGATPSGPLGVAPGPPATTPSGVVPGPPASTPSGVVPGPPASTPPTGQQTSSGASSRSNARHLPHAGTARRFWFRRGFTAQENRHPGHAAGMTRHARLHLTRLGHRHPFG